MSERDKMIASAILTNMTEEQKQHYHTLLVSHDKAVTSFCAGKFLMLPAIEVRFIQVGEIVIN